MNTNRQPENSEPPNRRILVIDDNPAIHQDFKKILCDDADDTLSQAEAELFGAAAPVALKAHSYELTSAHQGREGLEAVCSALEKGTPFAMAFVDVRMPPGWDGMETVTRIWQVDPDVQVVLCTAYSDYSWDETIARFGVSDRFVILKKPFDMVEVLQLANALTEKWSLLQQSRVKLRDLEEAVAARTRELQESNEHLVREIQERQRTEEALRQAQRMESIGQLAGGVAHDFNNLLMVILGHVEMLIKDEQLSAPVGESLHRIQNAAERAGNLTRQLLAFSRKQVMRPRPVDINEMIESMVRLLGRTLGEHITINTRCEPGLSPALADPVMMEQVVMNLAINARDAMRKGGELAIQTSVKTFDETMLPAHPEARPGRYVCLSVTDTGSGIAPENLPRIFEPFFTTKELGKGTGLGLATVYGNVRQHNGWIEVESRLGHGTTFHVYLPVSLTPAHAARTEAKKGPVRGGRETILVVEDEPSLRLLMNIVLRRQGYTIHLAASGAEAMATWAGRLEEIQLLVTDIVMPDGLSGWELAREFQAIKPSLKTVFISGYNSEINAGRHELDEQICFLEKPFSPQKLAEAIRDQLDNTGQDHKSADLAVAK